MGERIERREIESEQQNRPLKVSTPPQIVLRDELTSASDIEIILRFQK